MISGRLAALCSYGMGAPQLGGGPRGVRGLAALESIPARLFRVTTQAFGMGEQDFELLAQFGGRVRHSWRPG